MIGWEGVCNQPGRLPGLGGVAKLAFYTKGTSVDIGFFMAGDAIGRGAAIFLVGVAFVAGDLVVLTRQWEEIGMIKGMQPVDAIMAGDA